MTTDWDEIKAALSEGFCPDCHDRLELDGEGFYVHCQGEHRNALWDVDEWMAV